jgi:hypothetical protein
MTSIRRLLSIMALGALVAGCGDNTGGSDIPAECNPLGGTNCMTPWPNGIYQVEDASSPTGVRNAVPLGALPTNLSDIPIDPDLELNKRSGFSIAAPILTAFSTGVDGSNLVSNRELAASLTAASPTVLIDTSTGELVEHFAELDARAADTPDKQALFIRPSTVLEFSTRYVVAIKRTLKAPGGADLPIPPGYQAILDGSDSGHELLERMRPRFDSIFAELAAQGVAPEDLVVAWDFTTTARDDVQRNIIAARDRALDAIDQGAVTLGYTVESDVEHGDPLIARRIEGTFTAPLFMSQDGRVTPETRLERDGEGLPIVVGSYEVPFVAIVPECALDPQRQEPVGMMIYGHGLLGSANQVASGGVRALVGQDHACMVAYGTHFRGFADIDLPNLALMLNDANKQDLFFPIQIQGLVDHIVLTKTAQGPMAETLFVDDQQDSIVDPSKVFYYGISQGGIMGGIIMGYEPSISRAVLQVGAVNYSMLLERSLDWPTYRTIMIGAYPDPLDVALLINLMQEFWDTDPANVVYDMIPGTIEGSIPKQILMQIAVADDEVSNIASEYQARTMGINALEPSVYEPQGVPVAAGPLDNGLVLFDWGLGDTIPLTNEAPPDNDVHGDLRFYEATTRQIGTFFETGEIQSFCGESGCTCLDGGCGIDHREEN